MGILAPVSLHGAPIPAIQLGTVQADFTAQASGGSNAQSAAFGTSTTLIAVSVHITGTGVRVLTGANPDATSSQGWLLPASGSWFFYVHPGWKLAAISNDANTVAVSIAEAADAG